MDDYFSRLKAAEFDLVTLRPLTWPPIEALANWHTGALTNVLGYSNPELDAALDRRDWKAAQRALQGDPPMAVVCTPPYVIVVDARIKASDAPSR